MSMTILTILQICAAFLAYTVVTCVLPLVLIHRRLPDLRLSEKLMLSAAIGNFYIINEVFLLEFLHIACRATLILGTLLPFAYAMVRIYEIPVREKALSFLETTSGVLNGAIGLKTLILRFFTRIGGILYRGIRRIGQYSRRRPFDVLFFLATSGLVLYEYLPNLLANYGYKLSDLPVHNYWINYLGKGQLFVDGVYPYGFHCAIYYLHAVFGIETYVLLRVFSLVQTMFVIWMLLYFLKASLKSAYLPYIAAAIYAAGNLFAENTYYRYCASLPQEFGMIFILPAVYFGFAYFRTRRKWCLVGFGTAFSLTLAIHFYGVMIAGLFSVAMAIGFAFRFFRKSYFLPIVATCFLSVAAAAAPMVLAYALGTPLQGSLGWGLSIVNGTDSDEEADEETTERVETEIEDAVSDSAAAISGTADDAQMEADGSSASGETSSEEHTAGDLLRGVAEKIAVVVKNFCDASESRINEFVFRTESPYFARSVIVCIAICLLFSVLYLPFGERDRTGRLLTVAVFMLFMNLLFLAEQYHLPKLMDNSRISIYYTYMLPVLYGFAADAVLVLPGRLFRKPVLYQAASLAVCVLIGIFFAAEGLVKSPYLSHAMETNDAIVCMANIMRQQKDMTWTICSANDELRMTEDYGFHEELIDFLYRIDNIGRFARVNIPTQYTYFFVEKTVIDYAVSNEKTDMTVSEEYASRSLPGISGLLHYENENRAVVMSRIYYWCEAFMQMYPENMTVYYESDDFICYELEQNTDQLFELGIDYGYNRFDQ